MYNGIFDSRLHFGCSEWVALASLVCLWCKSNKIALLQSDARIVTNSSCNVSATNLMMAMKWPTVACKHYQTKGSYRFTFEFFSMRNSTREIADLRNSTKVIRSLRIKRGFSQKDFRFVDQRRGMN